VDIAPLNFAWHEAILITVDLESDGMSVEQTVVTVLVLRMVVFWVLKQN